MRRLGSWITVAALATNTFAATQANRLTHLDQAHPAWPDLATARLITPQWVGEEGVEAVVVLAVNQSGPLSAHESWLRPVLERLQRIDGRAPVSVFCHALEPADPLLQRWLNAGVSLEVQPPPAACPLLANGDLAAARTTFQDGIERVARAPHRGPVAFRMPCGDITSAASPRFFREIFATTPGQGQFLTIDSSVTSLLTAADPALPREWVQQPDGTGRFPRYVPASALGTTVENYPYPYVIDSVCWEFPALAPSDRQAQTVHGSNYAEAVADWKLALDATILKQGVLTFMLNLDGATRPEQWIEFIDYAVGRYGARVKFLNFLEAQTRLDRHLLDGQSLRDNRGADNGVRVLDLNGDGFMDVTIGNDAVRRTRVWDPTRRRWVESGFPWPLAPAGSGATASTAGVQFGVVRADGSPIVFRLKESERGVFSWIDGAWRPEPDLERGLVLAGQPLLTVNQGRDTGARLRDVDRDGVCEWVVAGPRAHGVLGWNATAREWQPRDWTLPDEVRRVDEQGRDGGLRWADINGDGYEDLLQSDSEGYSVHVFIAKAKEWLGWKQGWSFRATAGRRSDPGALPAFVRAGASRDNGAWVHRGELWMHNEDTTAQPHGVGRRSLISLLTGSEPRPRSPEESLAAMHVASGFRVELVACEPLVIDPVAFDWDLEGRMWVVEMRDYPLGLDGHGKPGGVVKRLEDTDGDGRYDRAHVFLEDLRFPTGVMPWRKGVLVSAAPEVFYAEDTDGDGRADLRRTLLQGFALGNQQHRVNGFEYGLDNWVYAANGDSGGEIRVVAALATNAAGAATAPARVLRRSDLRFRPDSGELELVSGTSQFGRRRDDAGHWFGNNNPNWLWHYAIEDRYLARNPHLEPIASRRMLAAYPDSGRVFARSAAQVRFNWADTVNHVTSACSPTPYRDDLFGPEFATSVFVSEPAHNAIHREVLTPDGASFVSARAPGELQAEFLASEDNWFRPTQLRLGPDGALYIADMYRLILEHPEYFPDELKTRPDLRAGEDRGRIYRVVATAAPRREWPRLAGLAPAEWVRFVGHPSGWVRDTVQRLFVHAADPAVTPELRQAAARHADWRGRLTALAALEGRQGLDDDTLRAALRDTDPRVTTFAVELAEHRLSALSASGSPRGSATAGTAESAATDLLRALEPLARSASPTVRLRLALALGESTDPVAGRLLFELGRSAGADELLLGAILSSALPHLRTLATRAAASGEDGQDAGGFAGRIAALCIAAADKPALEAMVRRGAAAAAGDAWAWSLEVLTGIVTGLDRAGIGFDAYGERFEGESREAWRQLGMLRQTARTRALDTTLAMNDRVRAIELLGRTRDALDADLELMLRLATEPGASELRSAVLARMRRLSSVNVPRTWFAAWRGLAPALRREVLSLVLTRPEWCRELLAAVRAGTLAPGEIGAAERQRLLTHDNFTVRAEAARLFEARAADRASLLRDYARLESLSGSPDRGRATFAQHCATCHRFGSEGHAVGPALETMRDKPLGSWLVAILDPNQAVDAAYTSYTVTTRDGREITGILAEETAGGVRMRGAGGVEETIRRSEIATFTGSQLSPMPEGFERILSVEQMADLLAYLRGAESPLTPPAAK